MGSSLDNWHKYHKTGGKRKPYHKKLKYELSHKMPTLRSALLHQRRPQEVPGPGAGRGHFSWGWTWVTSPGALTCTCISRIIDVYNASNNELSATRAWQRTALSSLTAPRTYGQWSESHYALPLSHKKEAKLTPEEEELFNKKRVQENPEEIR